MLLKLIKRKLVKRKRPSWVIHMIEKPPENHGNLLWSVMIDHFWACTVHPRSRRSITEKRTKSLAQTHPKLHGREAGREATKYSNHYAMQAQLKDISLSRDVGMIARGQQGSNFTTALGVCVWVCVCRGGECRQGEWIPAFIRCGL